MNNKLGYLGFLGLLGIMGILIHPFLFGLFGFFSFFDFFPIFKEKRKKRLVNISVVAIMGASMLAGFIVVPNIVFNNRVAELNEFADFADDGVEFAFTFDLNRRGLYADLIEEFGLDEITAGHYDIDLMIVLLNWVRDNFNHHGASSMPDNRDAMSIINFMRENPRGINCRGLAILLAEVLRLYGIEAKHVTVMPPEDDHFVHVVTHAFSWDLQQWIMLDPTFRIYLQDEYGNFMNLYKLRRSFADGTQSMLIANENAQFGFMRGIRSWERFMADYLFRFSTATNFTFGSDYYWYSVSEVHQRNVTGERRERSVMLVPVGFDFGEMTAHYVTTSAEAFFTAP